MESDSIIGGIISGLLATAIWYFSNKIIRYYKNYKIKLLLGSSNNNKNFFYLVFGEFILRPPIIEMSALKHSNGQLMPYCKPDNNNYIISIKEPISKCEVVAMNYILTTIISKLKAKSKLISDTYNFDNNESNIISFGGKYSNTKTEMILNEAKTEFGEIHSHLESICNKRGNYGYILKYTPKKTSEKSWIIVAGSGESGTTGSAWFLANRYKEIFSRLYNEDEIFKFQKSKNFLAFIHVRDFKDENSEIIEFY